MYADTGEYIKMDSMIAKEKRKLKKFIESYENYKNPYSKEIDYPYESKGTIDINQNFQGGNTVIAKQFAN